MFGNSKTKRILVLLLSLLMLISVFPLAAFAGDPRPDLEEAGANGKLKWYVFKETTLFIHGDDDMSDFCINFENGDTGAPWRDYKDKITTIVIENGVPFRGR